MKNLNFLYLLLALSLFLIGCLPKEVDEAFSFSRPQFKVTLSSEKISQLTTNAKFSISLNTKPTNSVTLTLSVSDPVAIKASVTELVFTPENYDEPQDVLITSIASYYNTPDTEFTIYFSPAVSEDKKYSGMDPEDIKITRLGLASPGISSSKDALTVNEDGTSDTFTIKINVPPPSPVTIGISSSSSSEALVNPTNITFTSENWQTPQTITVTGVDDDVADGDQTFSVQFSASSSIDPDFNGFQTSSISGINQDNDTAGFIATPLVGIVNENGGSTAIFTVQLTALPTANVTIPVSSSLTTEATANVSSLVFTPANWNTPQTVTVTGIDDFVADGSQNFTIVLGTTVSSDSNFNGLNPADVSGINDDNDTLTFATKLAFNTQPGGGNSGAVWTQQPTVQILDSSDRPLAISGFTVTLAMNSGSGSLSGAVTAATNASGLATFSGLSVGSSGAKTILATGTGLSSATSNSFNIINTLVAPTVTAPSTNPYTSSETTIQIAGGCTSGTTVNVTGDGSGSSTCSSSAYSIGVSASSGDGTYNYQLSQTDSFGNTSSSVPFQWVRNATPPATPTITSPTTMPYSSQGNLTISGACTSGLLVTIGGNISPPDVTNPSGSLTQYCASNFYSYTVTKASEGLNTVNIKQTSATNVDSQFASMTWTIDKTIPNAPSITTPASSSFISGDTDLLISGACETLATVALSGASSDSITCTNSSYSFTVSKSSDGTYDFELKQTDPAGNASSSTPLQWIRNASIPPTPTINAATFSSNDLFTVSGSCVTSNTVTLGGNVIASEVTSPSGSLTQVCSSSLYSFTVTKTSNGSYTFSIKQTAGATDSNIAYTTWTRDTLAPLVPVITAPSVSSYISGDTSLSINGSCESNASVTLAEDIITNILSTVTCIDESFNFNVNKTADQTYSFLLRQTDRAGNDSPTVSLGWTSDTTMPPTPDIWTPSTFSYYSTGSSLTISGSCESTHGNAVVALGGNVLDSEITSPPGNSLEQTCTTGSFSYTLSKSDPGPYNQYNLNIVQTRGDTFIDSAAANLVWVINTANPAMPTITSPTINPYTSNGNLTISGGCETADTVYLSGAESQSTTCSGSLYSFTTSTITTDGTHNFTIKQKNLAGNFSADNSLQWIRASTVPNTPVITIPASNPYSSNTNSLTLSGSCQTGLTVTLSGDLAANEVTTPSGSLTTTCSSSSYTFVVVKGTDATYSFNIKQTNGGLDSASASQSWSRDTTPPTTTLLTKPDPTNIYATATFTFSADQTGSTFECKMDSGNYAGCASGINYSSLSNGVHTFYVKSTDPIGNTEASPVSYTWTQAAYNTVALYHFDTGSETTDSSSYTGSYNNSLTQNGGSTIPSTNTSNAKFGTAAELFSSGFLASPNSPTNQILTTQTMTFEAFVKFTSSPSLAKGTTQVIASKLDSSNYGWSVEIYRSSGGTYYLQFRGSLNGTTLTTVKKSISVSTGTYYHLAVTWNQGTVSFYFNGSKKGTATIGSAGSAVLYSSTAPLRIGADHTTSKYLKAYLDEARLSQVLRYTGSSGTYTIPSASFTAD